MHNFKRFLLDTSILKQMAEYRVKRYELDVPLALIALVGMMFLFTALAQNLVPISFCLTQTSNTIAA